MKAYDLSRYQRLIGVESERITGTFKVLLPVGGRRATVHVTPVEVRIWDSPEKHSGRILHYPDFTAFVDGEDVSIPLHMVNSDKRADVQEAMDELERVLLAVAERAKEGGTEPDRYAMTTITTVAELEALPVGSVVLGKDIGHVRRPVAERIKSRIDPEALWSVDGVHYYMSQTALAVLDHEGTVLFRPDARAALTAAGPTREDTDD